ncbi:aspartate/glutamate racemase family protein [Azospirillum canadense]|uniref:aspartate/glutamate racemase family protein n=1 Tax=Azospirillum canadense TaxID=403962 RepID=UPI002227E99E|nr:aspartate/glutamate racemase family protein [Azospirillum canadense]MCW2243001.1 aspartate racemase [Azospirillum canadense]
MKTLGLIGGMSWESTAIYYRHLNEIARNRLGGLHSAKLLLWSVDFAEIAERQHAGDWDGAATILVDVARRLEGAGAEALVICTNTMHKLAGAVELAIGIPLVHIADATAGRLKAAGAKRPALLATRFTMEQDFYTGRLRDRHGLDVLVPDEAGRALVHRVIYDELCRGEVKGDSKAAYLAEIERLRAAGADSVILGCTEITMLIGAGDTDLPVFDTTRIHAEAAMDVALGDGAVG